MAAQLSGQRRPRTHTHYVTNPITKLSIQVGGRRFRALTGPNGSMQYDERTNKLYFTVDNLLFMATEIRNPSTQEIERRATPIIMTTRLRNLLRRVVRGRATVQDFVNHPDLLNTQPFIAQNLYRFTWGLYDFDVLADEDDVVSLASTDVVENFLAERLLHDNPLHIPYVNARLNAGTDEACAERFLGFKPASTTLTGMLRACEEKNILLQAYDMLGGVIASSNVMDPVKVIRCIICNAHVYPIDGGKPRLQTGPVETYEDPKDVYPHFTDEHAAYFKRDSAFFVGGSTPTVFRKVQPIREPWMDELLKVIPLCGGIDPAVSQLLKASTLSLLYNDPSLLSSQDNVTTLANPDQDFITIDMSKCYFNTVLTLVRTGAMINPTIFDRFKPCVNLTGECEWTDYFLVNEDLSRFGILSNMLCGEMVNLLRANNVSVTTSHSVRFTPLSPTVTQDRVLPVLNEWKQDPTRMKKYALVNGIMGSIRSDHSTSFEILPEYLAERNYYVTKYGAKDYGRFLYAETSVPQVMTRLNWHAHVISMASVYVLKYMFQIRALLGVKPVRIKVDSLMYRRVQLQTPFMTSTARLQGALSAANATEFWRVEPHPEAEMLIPRATPYRMLIPPVDPVYENITYIGAPGTGKTWHALNVETFDIAVCYSNRGARRIGGRTIHSVFRTWSSDGYPRDMDTLSGKTIFVDEAQAASRRCWGWFFEAYYRVGARFIFAMDPDQIPPVGERPVVLVPFCGRITKLTKDYRNDPSLVVARQAVIDGTFEPDVVESLSAGRLTTLNIAYTRKTCRRVNQIISCMLNKRLGDDGGLYLAKTTSKRHGFMKGEYLTKHEGHWYTVNDDQFDLTAKEVKTLIEFGYCTTIHKQIGATFDDPFTIWDVDHPLFDTHLLYTAVTRGRSLDQITFRPVKFTV